MREPVLAADEVDALLEDIRMRVRYPMVPAAYSSNLSEKFANIRRAYREFQARVDVGLESWFDENQYTVGDWVLIFTPIEQEAWYHIRRAGLPLWPQLPVAGFFLDFGNPVAKVALECDGAAFHDPKKDAARDRKLADLGWTVYRAPGWQCMRDVELREDFDYLGPEAQALARQEARAKTLLPVIEELARHFPRKDNEQ